jgi:DNA-binding transcriptional ArsR family regulator
MASQAVFSALVEPRRRDILQLVRDRPRSAGEIGSYFDITQQAVSQHLQVLSRAGLVEVKREGQRRIYAINPAGLETLEQFLAGLWPDGLHRLKRAVESDRGH